jgi:hypothetical protein
MRQLDMELLLTVLVVQVQDQEHTELMEKYLLGMLLVLVVDIRLCLAVLLALKVLKVLQDLLVYV